MLGVQIAGAQSPLLNGSFESPVVFYNEVSAGSNLIAGWTIEGVGPLRLFHGPNVDSPMGASDGDQFVAFNAGTDPAGTKLFQNIATVVGEYYTVSFTLGRAGYQTGLLQMLVEARTAASTLVSSQTNNAPSGSAPAWGAPSTFNFTAQSVETLLIFQDVSPSTLDTDLLLDNVSVVPEPSTYALLLLALAAVHGARRIRLEKGCNNLRSLGGKKFSMRACLVPFVACFILIGATLKAQPLVSIEAVAVGDAGNARDTSPSPAGGINYLGSVATVFAIGKHEVTISQYNSFLNSVASVTSANYIVSLWNANMATSPSIAGIVRNGSGSLASPFSYSVIGDGNRPISFVSWFDAARFANWKNNGATNGASTEFGAYALNGATTGMYNRSAGATWFLPSEDEWYKSAYYKAGGTNAGYWAYPTKSDIAPSNVVGGGTNSANFRLNDVFSTTQSFVFEGGSNYLTPVGAFSNSASPYGTFDQAGNVFEWNEAISFDGRRGTRGGGWILGDKLLASSARDFATPESEESYIGFRVASVPEPSTYGLLVVAGAAAALMARRRAKRG